MLLFFPYLPLPNFNHLNVQYVQFEFLHKLHQRVLWSCDDNCRVFEIESKEFTFLSLPAFLWLPPYPGPCGTMNSLISFILHPLITLNIGSNDEEPAGVDVFYLLSIFFALGIWLVFQRYQKMHNSPVPFSVTIPNVCIPY